MTLGAWEAARNHGQRLDIRLAVDNSLGAIEVYRANFQSGKDCVRQELVERLFDGTLGRPPTCTEAAWMRHVGKVDLIVSGPPCQGYSDLNNRTRRNDARNGLYLRVVRAAELLRPKAVIIENVPQIVLDPGRVVEQARRWFERNGYHVSEGVIVSTRFAVPQLRRRHVLVAAMSGEFALEELGETGVRPPTAGEYLAGLEDEHSSRSGIFYRPTMVSEENRRRIDYLFDHDLHDLPDSLRPVCHRDKIHKYRSMYGRMHWDKPAQTVTSGFGSMGQGRYVHPSRRRMLTPHEAARLQGFPDFFDFEPSKQREYLKDMIANAVPPQITAVLVKRMIDEGTL